MKVRLYKHYWIYLLISLAFILISAWSLLTYGLNLGLDFTGGSLMEIKLNSSVSPEEGKLVSEEEMDASESAAAILASTSATLSLTEDQVRAALADHYNIASIQTADETQLIVRGEQIDNARQEELLSLLQENISPEVAIVRFESVGPTMGRELLEKTWIAIGIVAIVLVLYLRYQFKDLKYGMCALLGVVHDTFILLGIFSLLGHFYQVEVDSMFMTALLTTISFSVHDTIVMYDRIRELSKKFRSASYHEIVEAGVLQTLTRSLNNSMTVVFMLTALVLLGGPSIHWFAFALLAGVIFGTYSSPFVSIPLLLLWDDLSKYLNVRKQKQISK